MMLSFVLANGDGANNTNYNKKESLIRLQRFNWKNKPLRNLTYALKRYACAPRSERR